MDNSTDTSAPIELAIVDVFTTLIFGVEQQWSDQQLSILQALCEADHNVYMGSEREMGNYLRALGVQEMISLVSRVKNQLQPGAHYPLGVTAPNGEVKPHRRAQGTSLI